MKYLNLFENFDNIVKMQDNDSHWYWIPKEMEDDFYKRCREMDGKEYMDDPDAFDEFIEMYDDYRTGGDPNLKPDIFNK